MFEYLSNAGYILAHRRLFNLCLNAGNKNAIIIAVAVAILVTLVTIICALFLWRRMKQKVESKSRHF